MIVRLCILNKQKKLQLADLAWSDGEEVSEDQELRRLVVGVG